MQGWICFEELAHTIVEAGRSRSADGRPRDEVTQQPKAVGWQNYLFLGGTQSLFKGLQLIR